MKGISVSSFSLRLTSQQRILSPLCRHVRAYSRKQLPVIRGNQKLFSLPAARHLSTDSSAPLLPFKKYTLPVKGATTSAASMDGAMNGNHESPPKKRTAYIALGSNLGDRIAWIEKACNEMDARGIKVKRTSSLWETEPMYVLDQDRFVNGVCEVETTLEPLALLDALQDIENSLGRKKIIDKGPRNIDLDILLYENQKVDHPRLKIPHIGIPEREFVLKPLAELIPDKPVDPARPWTLVQDYLNNLPPSSGPALTTLTPLSPNHPPIQALQANRKTHIMAILNVTPDSFSDGGKHFQLDESALVSTVQSFLDAGATMIDIGGQSTAPNAPEISAEEELARVIPAIRLIRSHFPLSPSASPSNPSEDAPSGGKKQELLISVDTYRASVAEAAVAAGADMVNDVSGGSMDPDMLPTVARLRNTTICLMHMRGTPATMNSLATYPESEGGLIGSIARELVQRVRAAEEAGIRRWRIVLDPGLGFAKIGRQNVDVLRHLAELRSWPGLQGLPWLVGSSRKKFIGSVTGVNLPKERIWGTAATVAAAVQGGADVVRVHDVREMAQVALMADAVWRY